MGDDVRAEAVDMARRDQLVTKDVVECLIEVVEKPKTNPPKLEPSPTSVDAGEFIFGDVRDTIPQLIANGKLFKNITADCPWEHADKGSRSAAANEYPLMSTGELCGLPVAKLAASDCFLHLWTTATHIVDALRVIDAWGFQYVTQSIWCKPSIGVGRFWRTSHEIALLGRRGKPKFLSNSFGSWFEAERRKHSEKPDEFRLRIEAACSGPHLEIFGRRAAADWVVLGNELL